MLKVQHWRDRFEGAGGEPVMPSKQVADLLQSDALQCITLRCIEIRCAATSSNVKTFPIKMSVGTFFFAPFVVVVVALTPVVQVGTILFLSLLYLL